MNYTEQANKVIQTAKKIAKERNHPYVGTEHLLLGLQKEISGVAGQILSSNGVEEEKIWKVVEELVSPVGEEVPLGYPQISPIFWRKVKRRRFGCVRIGLERNICCWHF